ncbi:MAG TPA: secretin and TonB N-terminal domain-containing protein [Burkholderiales bacterium]|nr:secretin and TonB N-terminal domain-containing protein [Burkholderiales bacterium]
MSKLAVAFLLVFAAGCAAHTELVEGRKLIEQGRMEEGVRRLEQGVKANPGNIEYRAAYLRARDQYINQLLTQGDRQRLLGKPEDAELFYQRVVTLDPGNARALAGLASAQAEARHRKMVAEAKELYDAGDLDGAQTKLRLVLTENPSQREARALARSIEEQKTKTVSTPAVLKGSLRQPVTLEFRDAPLKSVFEVLSRTSGINFVFDRDVRPDLRATIYVRDTTIEDALNFLLVTNQLEKKILNENTILVYPNLPNKARDYQELMVKSFYLANADVKQTLNLIKTVVKTRDVFIDERLNLLVMRDTPEAIRLAEKLIAAQDLAEPEVMLELEVLEVARSRLQELGIRYPSQAGFSIDGAADTAGQATLRELQNFNSGLVAVTVTDPALVINMRKQDGDTNILANPRIRVKNREKAKIHIGSKLPVITTTSSTIAVSESVTYLDVGLKLDVEPNVYLEDEVLIKVGLEVSNLIRQVSTASGTIAYEIGTRNTATALRLKNGETQVLAGLIQDEDRRTADKVPGLGDLPVLGRLFGSRKDERNKTEIVLLITPYVMRNLDRPPPSALELASGTEGSLGAAPLRLPGTGLPTVLPAPLRAQPIPQQSEIPPPAGEPPARPAMQTVLLSAPMQAQSGREFAVAVSVPPGVAGNVRLDLVYDASRLRAVGVEGAPGRVQLAVSGTTAVRFFALEGQVGPAQISVANISAVGLGGENIPLSAPVPVTVNLTP